MMRQFIIPLLCLPLLASSQEMEPLSFPFLYSDGPPVMGQWKITPESVDRYGYKVELESRGLLVLRVEFPTTIENGFLYRGTTVEVADLEGDLLRLGVTSHDVIGQPGRKYLHVAGSAEWLACLRLLSAFHKPDPSNTSFHAGQDYSVEIRVAGFLDDAHCGK